MLWHDVTQGKQAEETLRRQLKEMTVLLAVAATCADTDDEDLLVERITQIIGEAFFPDNFGLIFIEESTGLLHTHSSYRERISVQHTPYPLGSGITGRVALEGRPMRVSDVTRELAYVEVDPDTRSELCVPLKAGERIIGVINAESSQLDAFSQDDERMLTILADQIAVAIERLRVEATARQRVQELSAITRISYEITSVLDRQQVLDSIVQHAAEISNSNASGLFLHQPDGQLQLVATYGVGKEFIHRVNDQGVPLKGTAAGQAITTRRPFQVPDIYEDSTYSTPSVAEVEGIRAILALPMLRGDEAIGSVVIWHRQPRLFSREEERFLQALANQSVNAIENARLFEAEREQAERMAHLATLSETLSRSSSVGEVIHSIGQGAMALGEADRAAIYLRGPDETASCAWYQGLSSNYAEQIVAQLHDVPGGQFAQQTTPVLIPDVEGLPEGNTLRKMARGEEYRGLGLWPLVYEGIVIAAVGLYYDLPHIWTAAEQEILLAFTRQAAVALQNARLLAKTRDQAQQVQQIIETVPEGVVLLDANRKIVLANPAAQQYLATLLDEAGTDKPLSHLGDRPIETLVETTSQKPWHELQTQSTPKQIFEVAARPLEVKSQNEGWVLVLRDVTVERENQARVQMQERLATVGQLAAGIAHDFNNIMAAVVVYTDLVSMEPNLAPSSREQLRIIQQQVQRATDLIRQILDFSRRAVMEQIPLDLLPFIKELDKLLMRVLPENIHLELEYQPGTYMVKADPTRLQQAFMNLALNARDAMPSGGSLQFRLYCIDLVSEGSLPSPDLAPGEWIRLVIRDTGAGIPEDVLPHIFDPFFTTKPVGQGTGLGLAQAYGIIKQHRGSIYAQSEIGKGTTFTIYLPATKTSPQESPGVQVDVRMGAAGETVLVVEDDRAAREALQSLLESQNYRVLSAENGTQALDVFEREKASITLVVSDVVMPEMGGLALYQALKEKQPLIKILFVTGHPLDMKDQVVLEKGRVHWLQKPYSMQEFNTVLRTMLDEIP